MCYKDCNSRTMTKKNKKKAKKTRKPARKSRSKTRKPKFLSLISLELISSEKAQESSEMPSSTTDSRGHQQLRLFPLHPENLVEDKDSQDENMAYLLSAADSGASTLTGLLGAATTESSSGEDDHYKNQVGVGGTGDQLSQSVALVRTALKNKERDSSEERYVCYSEVVERRDEEVTSTAADLRCGNRNRNPYHPTATNVQNQRLSLKLDYEEILNAWSDKGPLYVYADPPQTVPDIHDHFLPHQFPITNIMNHGWRDYGCFWRVPELTRSIAKVHEIKEEEQQQQQQQQEEEEEEPVVVVGVGAEEWKVGQREASVLRYKEKRQNRLFSKRIRYQVRKLNAEKRPREKGRFVKRS